MLPRWVDNRKTYYDNWSDISIESLGHAIGQLGENGRDFLPFIENKIEEEKVAIKELEESMSPETREWGPGKDHLKRAYKKIERLYSIKQSIDPECENKPSEKSVQKALDRLSKIGSRRVAAKTEEDITVTEITDVSIELLNKVKERLKEMSTEELKATLENIEIKALPS